jgi:hypothetical protein
MRLGGCAARLHVENEIDLGEILEHFSRVVGVDPDG